MTGATLPNVGRRTVGNKPYGFSAVSLDLGAVPIGSSHERATAVAILRKARAAGVTTFDLATARDPAEIEQLLSETFPSPDPELVTILDLSGPGASRVPRPAAERSQAERDSSLESLRASLGQSLDRLGRNRRVVISWRPRPGAVPADAVLQELKSLRDSGTILDIAVRRDPSAPGPSGSLGAGPRLSAVGLSLLETDALRVGGEPDPDEDVWIARDVFAGGRLDGSTLSATATPPGPGVGPHGIRDLQAAFGPVLGLGFLTEKRCRTMAQAALHFALRWPWVVTASVPLPAPERLDEILGYARTPPLEPDEVAKVLHGSLSVANLVREREGAD